MRERRVEKKAGKERPRQRREKEKKKKRKQSEENEDSTPFPIDPTSLPAPLSTLTLRGLGNEVKGTGLGAQVLPAAVHPHVHGLAFVLGEFQSHVPVKYRLVGDGSQVLEGHLWSLKRTKNFFNRFIITRIVGFARYTKIYIHIQLYFSRSCIYIHTLQDVYIVES